MLVSGSITTFLEKGYLTVICKPRKEDRYSTKHPRSNQEQGKILNIDPLFIIYGQEDNDSCHRH